jgi:hypothetical protein
VGLAEGRLTAIGGVLQYAPDSGSVPPPFAARTGNGFVGQAPADVAQAQPHAADPIEDAADHQGLLRLDLVARLAATVGHAHVAVAVGSAGQYVDRPLLSAVTLAAAAALEHLGPLVLGDHALHLQQELILRGLAQGPVEEHDSHPGPLAFVHQHYLVGVLASQAIRRVHVQPLDFAGGHRITQPLQCRPDQGRAAVPLVDELVVRQQQLPVLGNALSQRCELAVDRVRLDLLLGRYPGIQGHRYRAHGLVLRRVSAGTGCTAVLERRDSTGPTRA